MFKSNIIVDPAPKRGGNPEEEEAFVPISHEDAKEKSYMPSYSQAPQEVLPPPPQQADLKKIPGRKKMWLIMGISIGVVVLGAGGIFAAYKQGYIDIPFLNPIFMDENVLENAVADVREIKSGNITFSFNAAVEPKTDQAVEASATSTDGFGPRDQAKAAQMKSDLSQYRTGLVLYWDDNDGAYPDSLDEVVPEYLSQKLNPPSSEFTYDYKVGSDNQSFKLTGTMTQGSDTYVYAIDEEGIITDTFPKSANASLLDDGFLEGIESMLPADFQVQASISAFSGKQEGDELPDALVAMDGSYKAGGTTIEAAMEGRVKDGTTYFKIKTFPSFFGFDLSALSDKWIKAPDDLSDTADTIPYIDSVSGVGGLIETEEAQAMFQNVFLGFFEKEFIKIGRKLPAEKIDGITYDKYEVEVKPENLTAAFKEMRRLQADYCKSHECQSDPSEVTDEELQEGVESMIGGSDGMISKLLANGSYTLWRARDGKGYKLEATMALAFPDSSVKLSGKQLRLSVTFMIDHINEEPNVEVPDGAIAWDEAERIMGGYTEAEWKFEQQKNKIQSVRSALSSFESTNDTYPGALSEIVRKDKDEDESNEVSSLPSTAVKLAQVTINEDLGAPLFDDFLYFANVSEDDLIDVYTNKQFVYAKTDDGYTLAYTMELPEESDRISSYDLDDFIEGANTADRYVVSREAESARDSDNDGLNGALELLYETNPLSRDTDYDGYSDFDEVQAGTDPLDTTKHPNAPLVNTNTSTNANTNTSPAVPSGTLQPNSGGANGGEVVRIGFGTEAGVGVDDVTVFFGSRRAYVLMTSTAYISVILPGSTEEVAVGSTKPVQVKVSVAGTETQIAQFSYIGEARVDGDSDGLPDEEELAIGTSKLEKDSDGDTYSDFDELNSGHNPLLHAYDDIDIIPHGPEQLVTGSEGTIHFWSRAHNWDLSAYRDMLNFVDADDNELLLIRRGASYFSVIVNNDPLDGSWTANDISWKNDEWMHFAVTWKEGETPKLYVNGVMLSEFNAGQETHELSAEYAELLLSEGTLYAQGRPLVSDGNRTAVSDIVIKNSVLSADEISAIFNKGQKGTEISWGE